MKKALALMLVLLAATFLFADNGQRIIPLESDVYSAMDALYILEGKALPSTSRPWTAVETQKILSKVSRETSPGLYDLILAEVEKEPRIGVDDIFGMSFNGYVSVTGYAHTDTAYEYPFNEMTNTLFRSANQKPTLRAEWESWAGNNLYAFVWYQYKNEFYNNGYSSHHFDFDIANLTPDGLTTDMDQREPSRAFFVVGGNSWSLEYGRDRMLMGTGNTGSLVISDVLPYHNLLRFSAFGTRYKYSFVMSFLPNLQNSSKGLLFYMTHRLESRFLTDMLYVAVNESIMYKNDDGLFDLRYVNPVMYFHNYFISFNANSIVDLETSFTFAKGWNMYGQFALDQFASPVEKAEDEHNDPLAFGALFGVQNVRTAGNGILTIGLEGAYTMPYLYLRATYIPEDQTVQTEEDQGLGYIADFRGKWFYLGYPYGGDAVVIDLKVSYEVPADWKISVEGLYMVHGEKNVRYKFRNDDNSFAPSGESWDFILLEVCGKKRVGKNVSFYGQYDMILGSRGSDNQFALGIEVGF